MNTKTAEQGESGLKLTSSGYSRHIRFLEPETFLDGESDEPDVWLRRYELYARKNGWNNEDKKDFLELYLGGRALRWFDRVKTNFSDWKSLKVAFEKKFYGKEMEIRAWKDLQKVKQKEDENVEDLVDRLEKMFNKAKLIDESVKLRFLLSSIHPKYQRSILKSKTDTYETAVLNACEEEQLIKACGFDSEYIGISTTSSIKAKKEFIKNEQPEEGIYETLIKRFDQLNLNFMKLANNSHNRINFQKKELSPEKDHLRKIGACFYCKEVGHSSRDCPKGYWNQNQGRSISSESNKKLSNDKNVGCIDLVNKKNEYENSIAYDWETKESYQVEIVDIGKEIENTRMEILDGINTDEIFAAEKRKSNLNNELNYEGIRKKKILKNENLSTTKDKKITSQSVDKINNSSESISQSISNHIQSAPIEEIGCPIKSKSNAIIRSKNNYKINENKPNYSLKNDLTDFKANITIAQLIQTSPEIRSELSQLLKKTEISKELKLIEENSTTNCKSIIKIFGHKYLAVIDTGAACSVISNALLDRIGLEIENEVSQTIITADGKKHSTLGMVNKIPISIAGVEFGADLLVMKNINETLILGTDWLKSHSALIDIRNQELVLPLENHDVVLSLSTTKNKDKLNGIYESIENEV
ncbi:hypothetical protein AYI70_g4195 [Smittium culicis]|uniref:CCHC-type domain-containing protein n=1 Tax=Smittium culicis TaxID=133412 RepID=A0A1R1Y0I3_9FUNG|nr:hypothetical protein AYI70_g4195 [Smittium culicis]